MSNPNPYRLLGGEAGVRELCARFYAIMDQLPEARDVRALHAVSLEAVGEKLFEYLSGWLGGPMLYRERHGIVCLSHAHRAFAIGTAERDQWLLCMHLALRQCGADDALREMLREPLFQVADMLVNHP